MKIKVIIRWTLSIALIYGVFTETGIFTAISMFLIFVSIELMRIMKRR